MIRRATATDLDALASLHRESIMSLCASVYSAEELAAWTAGIDPTIYGAPTKAANVVVAIENDTIVGFGVCDPSASIVRAVYVAGDAVRHGIGSSLMAAIEARLLHAGVSEARLDSTLNAVGFYEALGYSALERTTHRLPSGAELPCIPMTKQLQAVR